MDNIKPAKNIAILVQAKVTTKSGIEGISTGKNKPEIGEVVAIGNGNPPVPIKVGDKVVFRKYMDNTVFIASVNEDLNFVDFKEIVANLGNDNKNIKSDKKTEQDKSS